MTCLVKPVGDVLFVQNKKQEKSVCQCATKVCV